MAYSDQNKPESPLHLPEHTSPQGPVNGALTPAGSNSAYGPIVAMNPLPAILTGVATAPAASSVGVTLAIEGEAVSHGPDGGTFGAEPCQARPHLRCYELAPRHCAALMHERATEKCGLTKKRARLPVSFPSFSGRHARAAASRKIFFTRI